MSKMLQDALKFLKLSSVDLPTVLDHWGVGLHWGYCLGNLSWVQWVARLSLYTASMPRGQGAASWLRAWVTRHTRRLRRHQAMAGISSLVTGTLTGDHSWNTLLTLCKVLYLMVFWPLVTTTPGIPPLTELGPGVHSLSALGGRSLSAHSWLCAHSGSLSPADGVMAWKAWSLLTCAHYYLS